jgi:glycosyltransferase involved in cell wall biosynthesis
MKIVQVISHYMPAISFGGPLQVAHGLSRALIEAGHEVVVCTTSMRDATSDLDVALGEYVDVDGVRVIYEPVKRLRYWGGSRAFLRRAYTEVSKADVVFTHFHYQCASVVGGWCARIQHKPHIVFTHGSLNRYGIQAKNYIAKWLYLQLLERSNFKRALFTAYHSEKEEQESYTFSSKRQIIPIGIDGDLIKYAPDKGAFVSQYLILKNRFVFVYLGRLAPGKGLELLLDALHTLRIEGHDVALVLIGADERGYQNVLLKKIEALHLKDAVMFTGLLSGEAKFRALADADVFVLPSRSEGTSIVTLEAMALGLPVVVSDRVGLARDVLQQRCGLVTSYEQQALTHALLEIMTRDDRVAMGQRGRAYVCKTYDWSVITQNLLGKIAAAQGSAEEIM